SAPGWSAFSVTVSYGPTVPSWSTVTPLLPAESSALPAAEGAKARVDPQPALLLEQFTGGERTVVVVAASSVSNQASVEGSITAPARTGRTQANSVGSPEYLI